MILTDPPHDVQTPPTHGPCFPSLAALLPLLLIVLFCTSCASISKIGKPQGLKIDGSSAPHPPGAIVRTATGASVGLADLIQDLYRMDVVYVGEQHTSERHHEVQLTVLRLLAEHHGDLAVGMEMFDKTYQPVLARWSRGQLDRSEFLEKTHWYANWKFDFRLYSDILDFIRNEGISLLGLNIPPHIPPKIAVGGIESLSDSEKRHLPDSIDTSNPEHRSFVRSVFKHHRSPGLTNFEYFYQAQCVWEETMAEAVANASGTWPMLVLAGTGHIRHGYGIPERACRRAPAAYRTILPLPAGQTVDPEIADYIWVTAPEASGHPKMPE
jgi:uncharacterized iron-regulated protein